MGRKRKTLCIFIGAQRFYALFAEKGRIGGEKLFIEKGRIGEKPFIEKGRIWKKPFIEKGRIEEKPFYRKRAYFWGKNLYFPIFTVLFLPLFPKGDL